MTSFLSVPGTGLCGISLVALAAATAAVSCLPSNVHAEAARAWRMGTPIVSYWAGPMPITETAAKQMAKGHWNLVWVTGRGAPEGDVAHYRAQLDILQRYGLRGIVSCGLFRPATLDDPKRKAKLDAFVDGIRTHPALYAYHLKDEPNASTFRDLARMKNYLDKRDPSRLKFVNLYPNYANEKQLGTKGAPVRVRAYEEYVHQFIEVFKPQLLSYDHYHFTVKGDRGNYFLNLAQIRRAALNAGLPFMVIVQACSWTVNMRIPTGEELRWLTYTTLAYGAQGISHYVYGYRGHDGAMMNLADGSPTSLYYYARRLNKEFVAVATALRPLRSLAVYHAGTQPQGATPLPAHAPFRLDPPVPSKEFSPPEPVEGFLIGYFGKGQSPTHALVVNLDYRTYAGRGQRRREVFLHPVPRSLVGPGRLEVFDVATSTWSSAGANRVDLRLPPSGAILVRVSK